MSVCYKKIEGFPGYRVGDDGSVWTRKKTGNGDHYYVEWKRLKPQIMRNGYHRVKLFRGGGDKKRYYESVHRLVLTAFLGRHPSKPVCRHFPDPDRSNNSLENLSWGTTKENCADKATHGNLMRGETVHTHKLTEEQVISIRIRRRNGAKAKNLAIEFGLSEGGMYSVLSKKNLETSALT